MGVPNRGLTWPDHGQNQGKARIRFRVVFARQQRPRFVIQVWGVRFRAEADIDQAAAFTSARLPLVAAGRRDSNPSGSRRYANAYLHKTFVCLFAASADRILRTATSDVEHSAKVARTTVWFGSRSMQWILATAATVTLVSLVGFGIYLLLCGWHHTRTRFRRMEPSLAVCQKCALSEGPSCARP